MAETHTVKVRFIMVFVCKNAALNSQLKASQKHFSCGSFQTRESIISLPSCNFNSSYYLQLTRQLRCFVVLWDTSRQDFIPARVSFSSFDVRSPQRWEQVSKLHRNADKGEWNIEGRTSTSDGTHHTVQNQSVAALPLFIRHYVQNSTGVCKVTGVWCFSCFCLTFRCFLFKGWMHSLLSNQRHLPENHT